MTASQVRQKLGKPGSIKRGRDDTFGQYKVYRYGQTDVHLTTLGKGYVFSVLTDSAKIRTASGVGYGTTLAELKRDVRNERCEPVGGGTVLCTVGKEAPGRTVTHFVLQADRVVVTVLGTQPR